jgi:hypothetical protein
MKRKTVRMLVTITVPAKLTAAEARREVRTLINEQCNYLDLDSPVKVLSVTPVTRGMMEALVEGEV